MNRSSQVFSVGIASVFSLFFLFACGGGSGNSESENIESNSYFFNGSDGVRGKELWKTDGTMAGTVQVKNINIGDRSSHPDLFTQVNNTVFFRADDGINGSELWRSDGTEAGTKPIVEPSCST